MRNILQKALWATVAFGLVGACHSVRHDGMISRGETAVVVAQVASPTPDAQLVRQNRADPAPATNECIVYCSGCTYPCGDQCVPYATVCSEPPGSACMGGENAISDWNGPSALDSDCTAYWMSMAP